VSAKLKASAESVPVIDKRPWSLRLDEARSVAEIVTIEARIAAAYWRSFRDLGLRERKGGDLPRSCLRFANRQKGAQFLGSKHAMLNYAYVVEAGRLARALTAAGFALPIGFLHSDKHGRNSLVWDAIEPLRPLVDARVFKFIASREFVRSDFPQAGRNAHRIERAIIAELLRVSLLPWERHEDAARWMERTIADAVKQRLRD
jgi:CRISPR/Cas system-associated endonuclease Cas1